MDFQIKNFSGSRTGKPCHSNHRWRRRCPRIEPNIQQGDDETRPLLDCKILIDFQDSILKILPSDMTSRHTGRVIKGEARWFAHAKSLR